MQALYPSELAATYQTHQTTNTPFTRYSRLPNRLSNGFDNRFDNRVERTATVRSTGCQTGLYNRFDIGCIQPVVKPVVKWV